MTRAQRRSGEVRRSTGRFRSGLDKVVPPWARRHRSAVLFVLVSATALLWMFVWISKDPIPDLDIAHRPPDAIELGRLEEPGIRGLLRVRPFDGLVEISWASSATFEDVRDWYVTNFGSEYRLETETRTPSDQTLVGSKAGNADVVIGVSISRDSPVLTDLNRESLSTPPSSTRTYATVRIVDLPSE